MYWKTMQNVCKEHGEIWIINTSLPAKSKSLLVQYSRIFGLNKNIYVVENVDISKDIPKGQRRN